MAKMMKMRMMMRPQLITAPPNNCVIKPGLDYAIKWKVNKKKKKNRTVTITLIPYEFGVRKDELATILAEKVSYNLGKVDWVTPTVAEKFDAGKYTVKFELFKGMKLKSTAEVDFQVGVPAVNCDDYKNITITLGFFAQGGNFAQLNRTFNLSFLSQQGSYKFTETTDDYYAELNISIPCVYSCSCSDQPCDCFGRTFSWLATINNPNEGEFDYHFSGGPKCNDIPGEPTQMIISENPQGGGPVTKITTSNFTLAFNGCSGTDNNVKIIDTTNIED